MAEITGVTKSQDQPVRAAEQVSAAQTKAWNAIGPGLVLRAAVWLALTTGLLDAGIIGFRKLVLQQLVHRSPHVVWMAPLAYLFLFAGPALLLYLLARRWPRRVPPGVAFGLLALGTTTSVLILLFYRRFHDAALAILAIGLAAQFGRMTAAHLSGFSRLVRISTPWLAGIVAVLALGLVGTRLVAGRYQLALLPAARSGAPNVLLIILDTVRAASLSLYGYERATTPNLERWARRGVVFERAVAPTSWTLPSHGSFFTGRPPHELSTHWLVPLDDTHRTLAEAFRKNGYRTAGFVANLQYATAEMGLSRGFDTYRDYQISASQILMNSTLGRFLTARRSLRTLVGSDQIVGRKSASALNREFVDWTRDLGERPFFAFLNYYDAHDPYLPPDSFYRAFSGQSRSNQLSPLRRLSVRERRAGLDAQAYRIEMDSYDGSIAYLDHELDRLFRDLEQRGLLSNTLVIVTSDHGEEFGEHGLFFHGNSLYLPALHVPLAMWFPERVPESVRINEPVSLIDLAATIAELASLKDDSPFPGRSLVPSWTKQLRPAEPVRSELQKGIRLPDWYPVSGGDMSSLVWAGKHYIRNGDGREELYDWNNDRGETRNLADMPDQKSLIEYLRSMADPRKASGLEPGRADRTP